jgi:hypothetical protein
MTLTPLKTLVLAIALAGSLAMGAAAQEREGSW